MSEALTIDPMTSEQDRRNSQTVAWVARNRIIDRFGGGPESMPDVSIDDEDKSVYAFEDSVCAFEKSVCAFEDSVCTFEKSVCAFEDSVCAFEKSVCAFEKSVCPFEKSVCAFEDSVCAFEKSVCAFEDSVCASKVRCHESMTIARTRADLMKPFCGTFFNASLYLSPSQVSLQRLQLGRPR